MVKDIFISYKNDGEGNNFAARLKQDLEKEGYAVYFNSHERIPGPFPERLKNAVENCKDFVLVLSAGCIEQLTSNHAIDWVRDELLCAKACNKNIMPLLIGDAKMPKDKADFPSSIQFLADLEAVSLPEQYLDTPFNTLISMFRSTPFRNEYKYIANSNTGYDLQKDFHDTLERAKAGELAAMYEIACMYFYGFASEDSAHGKTNYAEAAKWLKELIRHFDGQESVPGYVISAHLMLADMYYSGSVTREEQSFAKAYDMLKHVPVGREDCRFDFDAECEKIISMTAEGVGTDFEYDEVLKLLEQYAMNCSNNGKNTIVKFYMRYGLYEKAIKLMESVSDNYPDIEYRLGTIYLQGLHCNPPKPDVYRAEHYLANAAYSGHLDALHALGLLNFRGQFGYRQNLPKAREYFLEAAKKGHRGASYDYARMCRYGLGGERNITDAICYFEQAAHQGHALSRAELAALYQEPECRDYQKAFEWAQKAAVTGDRLGEFILGNLFFWGRGCEADLNEAALYYQRAFSHGMYQAKMMLDKLEAE